MGMIPSCPLSSDGKDALYNGYFSEYAVDFFVVLSRQSDKNI